jgi:hypothetical protein
VFDSPPMHELSCVAQFFLLKNILPSVRTNHNAHLSRKDRRQKGTGCGTPSEIITRCVLYVTEEQGSTRVSCRYCCFFIIDKIRIFFIVFRLSGSVLITVYMPY